VNLVRLLLALSFIVVLAFAASAASAATENVTTGPYMVSFDLNSSLNYTVQTSAPIGEAIRTAYPLLIKTNNSSEAQITIFEYKELVDSTPSLWQTINSQGLSRLGLRNITLATDMIIDGKPAYGLSGLDSANKSMYSAYYWLDSSECECGPVSVGKTNVVVTSSYLLNLTGNLLDSLHVGQISQSMSNKPLTFEPPKK
jgi:hypothetical protein